MTDLEVGQRVGVHEGDQVQQEQRQAPQRRLVQAHLQCGPRCGVWRDPITMQGTAA